MGGLAPSHPHFPSLCQQLSPIPGSSWGFFRKKKNKKPLFLELIPEGYDSAKGSGDGDGVWVGGDSEWELSTLGSRSPFPY